MKDEDNPLTHVFALLRDLDQKLLEHGIRLDKIESQLNQVKDEKENRFNPFRGEENVAPV